MKICSYEFNEEYLKPNYDKHLRKRNYGKLKLDSIEKLNDFVGTNILNNFSSTICLFILKMNDSSFILRVDERKGADEIA